MAFFLSNESIENACQEADAYLAGRKVDSKDRIRIRFNLEEILLRYQKAQGSSGEFSLKMRGTHIRLTVPGPSLDPFAPPETSYDEEAYMLEALNRLGSSTFWRYWQGANEIKLKAKRKKMPEWKRLFISVTASVLCGLLVRQFPESIRTVLQGEIIAPLMNTFLGFMNAIAGPMIFLAVVWGIYSIGDTKTFSQVGKRLTISFGLSLVAIATIMAAASMPLFSLNFGKSAVGSGFSSLYQMVLNIIPVNLVMPFAEGNTLQILFIGVITGVALLLIGKKTEQVAELSEQLGLITNGIMNVIGRLVPFFVFGSLLNVIASSDLDTLAVGGKFFYSTIICCTLILAMHTGLTVYRTKLSPITLWKKTLSTFVIAVTTASSAAAFSDNLNTCINKLGISEKFADFGVPFGQILYKPGFTAVYWCAAISEAEYCGIEISGSWLIIALFMCIVLSAATPTIPGGGTASFSILFAQLGLPLDDLGVIISLNIILDFYYTAVNLFSSQCILLNTATQLHMVRHADAAGESRE